MKSRLAPLALFAYKRLAHLERTIASLKVNALAPLTELYIFCDGSRSEADLVDVAAVRGFVREIEGFASVVIVERECNHGLSASIVRGVSELLVKYESIIVLEDDMETSPYFLNFMNDGLTLYEAVPNVASIHAYALPIDGLPETYFMRGADCWGWATWRSRWQCFEPDAISLLKQLIASGQLIAFNQYGFRPLYLLVKQALGEVDSWYIRWHTTNFLANKLTLHTGRSFVHNTGTDGSGTHGDLTNTWQSTLATSYLEPTPIPPLEEPLLLAEINAWYLRNTLERLRSSMKVLLAFVGISKLWLKGAL